jgi:peptide/nickel transport system substrate-binding protein
MFTVNTTVAPWDKKEMRWALSYAIDREKMNQVVYEGTGAPAGFIFPDYPAMQPYLDAIKDMIAPVMTFDQAKSKQLIESQGYKLDSGSGKYVGPDGKNLSIDVVAPPFMQTPATFVVQNLNDVGIDAVLRIIEWGIFREQTGQGHFEGSTDWDGCGSVIEPWFGMNRYNKSWVQPIGKSGTEYVDNTNNAGRWSNDEYSSLVDQMGQLPIGDPKVIPLMQQAVKIWTDELPDIPLVQQPALMLFNTSKFTNWPTADNNYIQPPSHWEHFLRQLVTIKAAQ